MPISKHRDAALIRQGLLHELGESSPPSQEAAFVTPLASAAPVWVAVNGTLSGDWRDPAHWSGGVVPLSGGTIGDGVTTDTPWTVTLDGSLSGSLQLDSSLATVEITGAASFSSILDNAGTIEVAAGGLVQYSTLDGQADALDVNGGVWDAFHTTYYVDTYTPQITARSVTVENGGTLITQYINLGVDPQTYTWPKLPPGTATQVGTLSVTGGSFFLANASDSMNLIAGSVINVDASSSATLLGYSLAATTAGAIAIGSILHFSNGTINANVVVGGYLDDYVLDAAETGVSSGALVINGSLSGGGRVSLDKAFKYIDDTSTVDLSQNTGDILDASAFSGYFYLGDNTELILRHGGAPLATFALGAATIDLRDLAWTSDLTVAYDQPSGHLVVGGDTLNIPSSGQLPYEASYFVLSSDGAGGTVIAFNTADVWQGSGGALSGVWASGANWFGGALPDANRIVLIGNGETSGVPYTITATDAAAYALTIDAALATLAVTGSLSLADAQPQFFNTCALQVASGTLLLQGATLSTATAAVGAATYGKPQSSGTMSLSGESLATIATGLLLLNGSL